MRIDRIIDPRKESTEKIRDFSAPSQRQKVGEILRRIKEGYPTSSQADTKVGRTGVRRQRLVRQKSRGLAEVENLKWVCSGEGCPHCMDICFT